MNGHTTDGYQKIQTSFPNDVQYLEKQTKYWCGSVTILSKYIKTSSVKNHKSTNFDNKSMKDANDKHQKYETSAPEQKLILDRAEKYWLQLTFL